jgi:hypothetical protein
LRRHAQLGAAAKRKRELLRHVTSQSKEATENGRPVPD